MGWRGYFTCSNDFYQPSLRLEGGGGGQHPVDTIHKVYVTESLCYNMMFQAINKETFCEAVKAAQGRLRCFFKNNYSNKKKD